MPITKNGSIAETELHALIQAHMDKAYSLSYRLTGNANDAADLVQNAFIKVLSNQDKYNPKMRFDYWIYAIIRNLYIDGLRSTRGRIHEELKPEEGLIRDPGPIPEKNLEQNQKQSYIQSQLMTLEPNLRMVVTLVDIEGHSYEKAADILAWPLGTVCIRLHRARKILREKLSALLDGGDQ